MSPFSYSLFLEFAAIVACFKFKVLDEIPVLLNLMGGEMMHFFKCEKYLIEKHSNEPSPAWTEVDGGYLVNPCGVHNFCITVFGQC